MNITHPRCDFEGCENMSDGLPSHGQPSNGKASVGGMNLCYIHRKHLEWLDNSDIDRLGIVKFSHDLFPHRINNRFGTPPMHKEIYADIINAHVYGESKMDRLHAIAAPREHSKSTIVQFILNLYFILFGLKHFIVSISESNRKALQFIRAIKRELASQAVREYFGDVRASNQALDGGKWSESHIVTATGIHVVALGMGESARGLIEDTRPDFIVADDVESENNTKTENARENNWDWWKAGTVPAADMIAGQCVYIGTMIHYDCILARLMDQPNYRKHMYQVFTDATQTQTIWPEKFPLRLVRQIEEDYRNDPKRGIDQFFREYMNIAVAPENRKFGPGTLRMEDFEFIINGYGKWIKYAGEHHFVETFVGIDPAISANPNAAYTVILAIAVTQSGLIFIVDYFRGHYDQRNDPDTGREGTIEKSCEMVKTVRPETVAFEISGLGEPIANELERELTDLMQSNPEVGYPMLVRLRPSPDVKKEERIVATLESPFKLRRVIMRPSMVEMKTELEQFPKSKTFDIMDALTNAVSVMHVPYYTLEWDAKIAYDVNPPQVIHQASVPTKRDWETSL
ncbi:MAG: hypothetical protein IH600_16465 [Bacteroidetes bacterium]|nr:hypothetical protein [Bacteroidota bacterium]